MLKYCGILVLFFFFGCTKTENNPEPLSVSGDYFGAFSRINVETGYECNSEVTLSFTDSTFSGTSELQYHPAICSGKIHFEGNKIFFQNECVWPTHFDGSLILSEDWNYELYDNHLRFWKERGNIEDEYILSKIEAEKR